MVSQGKVATSLKHGGIYNAPVVSNLV